MSDRSSIRIMIADDFMLLRKVIRLYLRRAKDLEVVDEVPDLDDALARTQTLQPDVVIMNDYLPPIDSAHAAHHFRQQGFSGGILVISMKLELEQMQRSFENGVTGFMNKDEIQDHLVEAVRCVHTGQRYLSPKVNEVYSPSKE